MASKKEDAMVNPRLLSERAYKDSLNLDRRKGIYQFTHPYFDIEDEVIKLHSLKNGQSLLDVGCGTGKLLLRTAQVVSDAQLVGLDISRGIFGAAQNKAKTEGLNVDFCVGDVQSIPFSDSSFNKVVAMHMLYHSSDIGKALAEIKRVLKPGGAVIITANSMHSRRELNFLKKQAAETMGRPTFTDPNMRFNLENGVGIVEKHFKHVQLLIFDSLLRLANSKPYIDYFDSLREFWQPLPADDEWSRVMALTKQYVEQQIALKGEFTDKLGFGAIIASE